MWQGERFAFDRQTISAVVAPCSGVYLLWNAQQWIYVGETQDLRGRLLAHLDGIDPRISSSSPQAFGFEVHSVRERCSARCKELVRELNPICNVSHLTLPRPLATPRARPPRTAALREFDDQESSVIPGDLSASAASPRMRRL